MGNYMESNTVTYVKRYLEGEVEALNKEILEENNKGVYNVIKLKRLSELKRELGEVQMYEIERENRENWVTGNNGEHLGTGKYYAIVSGVAYLRNGESTIDVYTLFDTDDDCLGVFDRIGSQLQGYFNGEKLLGDGNEEYYYMVCVEVEINKTGTESNFVEGEGKTTIMEIETMEDYMVAAEKVLRNTKVQN